MSMAQEEHFVEIKDIYFIPFSLKLYKIEC
jgi:hypothetical protein